MVPAAPPAPGTAQHREQHEGEQPPSGNIRRRLGGGGQHDNWSNDGSFSGDAAGRHPSVDPQPGRARHRTRVLTAGVPSASAPSPDGSDEREQGAPPYISGTSGFYSRHGAAAAGMAAAPYGYSAGHFVPPPHVRQNSHPFTGYHYQSHPLRR